MLVLLDGVSSVDVPAMPYPHHDDNKDNVSDFVENAIVAHPNAVGVLLSGEFLRAGRARVLGKGFQARYDTLLEI